jgi:DNA-binding NtrC family response regulator
LAAYSWPGNIRELQNVLKRIMILGDGVDNIDGFLGAPQPARPSEPAFPQTGAEISSGGLDLRELSDLNNLSLKKVRKKAMDQVEKEVISYVLSKTGWNRSKATKILKISYKTLLYKIKELGIQAPPDSF